jgi:hypothetical protein
MATIAKIATIPVVQRRRSAQHLNTQRIELRMLRVFIWGLLMKQTWYSQTFLLREPVHERPQYTKCFLLALPNHPHQL